MYKILSCERVEGYIVSVDDSGIPESPAPEERGQIKCPVTPLIKVKNQFSASFPKLCERKRRTAPNFQKILADS